MDKPFLPSFGRRKVRQLSSRSQTAYDDILPLLRLDPKKLGFEMNPSEVWLEIGFGGGEHMLSQLAQNLSIAMIGCEPFINGISHLVAHLSPQDYQRVRIWPDDVRLLLEKMPPSYFARVFILFPDPWPKKSHHKRRLITHNFMNLLLPTLQEGALLYIASDDVSYIEQVREVLSSYGHLIACSDSLNCQIPPKGWISTRYEQKALSRGIPCTYLVFQKKGEL